VDDDLVSQRVEVVGPGAHGQQRADAADQQFVVERAVAMGTKVYPCPACCAASSRLPECPPLDSFRKATPARTDGRNFRQAQPLTLVVKRPMAIGGSIVGTRKDLREVFELHAAGKTRA
jgi:hypothetical protein